MLLFMIKKRKNVKKMAKLDKERLGFKPDKGQISMVQSMSK